jgi:hypothetical protein
VKPLTALPPAAPEDVFVFPEVIRGPALELAQARLPAKKAIFCQNQYIMAMNGLTAERCSELGFSRFACTSAIAKGFLERVLSLTDVAVVPCFVDPEIFFLRKKTMQIALIPHKLAREAAAINAIFTLKYPQLTSIPWRVIENKSEAETAEIVGGSMVLLSLSFMESFGLVALEAMASDCIVAGFDGYGGREYATPDNGFWFAPDHLEEVADVLARIVTGLQKSEPQLQKMREAGAATAARYTKERTRAALRSSYGSMT